ncbi:MAG: hypothetical protein HC906_16160, partial [Bacteroidales bacterium]|nr:hypothetical protein [Bacteroidales bacterium]
MSNNNVLSLIQDKNGFLWFGTSNGLNRYDGYSFKVFENDPEDTTSLSDNKVRAIVEDLSGCLWVGTDNGLNYFDPATEQFRRFFFSENNSINITNNRINCLHLSKNNKLWLGAENGLYCIDLKTNKIDPYANRLKTRTNQTNKSITSITEDANGNIWLGMWWGSLKMIDAHTLEVKDFFFDEGGGKNNVVNVFVDSKNCLWVVYHLGGIEKIDLNHHTIKPITVIESEKEFGPLDEDKDGNLWIMSGTGSLTLYNPSTNHSIDLNHNIQDANGLSSGTITAILCDRNDIIWITTDKGIDYYDPNAHKFESYYHKFNFTHRDYCKTFYQDRFNQVWISVWDIGLVKYNKETDNYQLFSHQADNQQSISSNRIDGIHADDMGNIWLATYNGITVLDPLTNKVIRKIYHSKENPALLKNIIHANTTGEQSHFFWLEPADSLKIIDVKNQKELLFPLVGKGALNSSKIKCMIT